MRGQTEWMAEVVWWGQVSAEQRRQRQAGQAERKQVTGVWAQDKNKQVFGELITPRRKKNNTTKGYQA